jgi:hypothetical protein
MDSHLDHAARLDVLLAQVAASFRALPKRDALAARFREALAHHRLPGGYSRHDQAPRPMAKSFSNPKGESHA